MIKSQRLAAESYVQAMLDTWRKGQAQVEAETHGSKLAGRIERSLDTKQEAGSLQSKVPNDGAKDEPCFKLQLSNKIKLSEPAAAGPPRGSSSEKQPRRNRTGRN